MPPSSIVVTPSPVENSSAKILSFACRIPVDVLNPPAIINEDLDDPLIIHKAFKQQHLLIPPSMDNVFIENVGVVGTITLLGRSTAVVWVGWGRIHEESYHAEGAVNHTSQIIGVAPNRLMGPLMVSMPRKTYQGAFASDIPSSKLISVSDLESDMMACQLSERISQQLHMAILVSCYFDDDSAPKTNTDFEMGSDIERHMIRRRAMTVAEQEICRIISNHQLQA